MSIELFVHRVDSVLISTIWHAVDRLGAEQLLLGKPVGTYLCRKDAFAFLLEERLNAEAVKRVSLFTLTVLSTANTCTDYNILVHSSECWQIYDDDPSLDQKTFSGIIPLIHSLKRICRYPLYL